MYMHGRFDAILLKPAQVRCTGNRTHDPQLVPLSLHGHACTEWSPRLRPLPPSSPSRPRIAIRPRPESRTWPFMRPIHFPDFAFHLCGPASMSYVDKCVFSLQAQVCSKIPPLPLHAKLVNSTRCVVIARDVWCESATDSFLVRRFLWCQPVLEQLRQSPTEILHDCTRTP